MADLRRFDGFVCSNSDASSSKDATVNVSESVLMTLRYVEPSDIDGESIV